MDREKMWDKTKMCYDALVYNEGIKITNYEYQETIYTDGRSNDGRNVADIVL